MIYLLDTNICIYIIKKKPLSVINKLRKLDISNVAISSITLSEMEYGISKSSSKERNKLALTEFLAPIEILPYDDNAANYYGDIRSNLEKSGQTIGPLDTLIAAHTLALNAVLVTNNMNEFSRVKNLVVENWV